MLAMPFFGGGRVGTGRTGRAGCAPLPVGACRVLLAALILVGCGCSKESKEPPDPPPGGGQRQGTPTITAQPNPVPAGTTKFGTTTITWDTGDGTLGELYVSVNGGEEKRFSGKKAKGSQEASWIGKGVYEFRLYTKDRSRLLASVRVTRNK
jgi:hypothetical protein